MKLVSLKLAVLSALGLVAVNVVAAPGVAGFTNLPVAGFATTGGTTAYTDCSGNGCALFLANVITAPVAGFTLIASAVRPVVMNNTYTGGVNKTVGTVTDRVWRNAAKTECIYDAKFNSAVIDYNTTLAGNQYFQLNDFARAGFSGRPVDVAYYKPITVNTFVYRIGLSFTAVQNSGLPLITPAFTGSINSQSFASINPNWVDFKTFATQSFTGNDYRNSPIMYVKTTCNSAAPVAVPNALRFRQTQPPFIEVSVTGYAPPSAVAMPAPVNPF